MLHQIVKGAGSLGGWTGIHFDYPLDNAVGWSSSGSCSFNVTQDNARIDVISATTLLGTFTTQLATQNFVIDVSGGTPVFDHHYYVGDDVSYFGPHSEEMLHKGSPSFGPCPYDSTKTIMPITDGGSFVRVNAAGTVANARTFGGESTMAICDPSGLQGGVLLADASTLKFYNFETSACTYGRTSMGWDSNFGNCAAIWVNSTSSHAFIGSTGPSTNPDKCGLQKRNLPNLDTTTAVTFYYSNATNCDAQIVSLSGDDTYLYALWHNEQAEGTVDAYYLSKIQISDMTEVWTALMYVVASSKLNAFNDGVVRCTPDGNNVYVGVKNSTTMRFAKINTSSGAIIGQTQLTDVDITSGDTRATGWADEPRIQVTNDWVYIGGLTSDTGGPYSYNGFVVVRLAHGDPSSWSHEWFTFTTESGFSGSDRTITYSTWTTSDSSSTSSSALSPTTGDTTLPPAGDWDVDNV